MNIYDVDAKGTVTVSLIYNRNIEISNSGKIKWKIKEKNGDTIIRTGFINEGAYTITQLPKKFEKYELVIESREFRDSQYVYVSYL